jgi:hypothetical protein
LRRNWTKARLKYEGLGMKCEGLGMKCEGLGMKYEGLGMKCEGLRMKCEVAKDTLLSFHLALAFAFLEMEVKIARS